MTWRYRITPRRLPNRTSTRGKWFLAVVILITVVAVLTTGCQSLRHVTSAESAGLCHAVDGLTTAIAVGKGAVEANPLMAPIVGAVGPWGFFALKVALGYWIYTKMKDIDTDPATQASIGVHNLLICGAAIHNVGVINKLP